MRVAVATRQHLWDRLRRCDHAGYSLPCDAAKELAATLLEAAFQRNSVSQIALPRRSSSVTAALKVTNFDHHLTCSNVDHSGEWLNTSVTTTVSSRVLPHNEHVALQVVSLANRVLASFWCVEDRASTLEKYGSFSTGDRKRVASIASPTLTLKLQGFISGDTSSWCDHPDACSGNFGQGTSLEALEATRLLHGSMLTSHLHATQMQPSTCPISDWIQSS